MTPQELADKYPRLYHLTDPACLDGIRAHGLQSTCTLLTRFGKVGVERHALEHDRRPVSVQLANSLDGVAVLTDNRPLSMKALATCLDDGLTPSAWLGLLNRRVFFWPSEKGLRSLAGAAENKGKRKLLVSLDTLSLARAYFDVVEIAPFNTGATQRKPARRGLSTFTPLAAHSYYDWRRLRGKEDQIKEVTVLDRVEQLERFDARYEIVG